MLALPGNLHGLFVNSRNPAHDAGCRSKTRAGVAFQIAQSKVDAARAVESGNSGRCGYRSAQCPRPSRLPIHRLSLRYSLTPAVARAIFRQRDLEPAQRTDLDHRRAGFDPPQPPGVLRQLESATAFPKPATGPSRPRALGRCCWPGTATIPPAASKKAPTARCAPTATGAALSNGTSTRWSHSTNRRWRQWRRGPGHGRGGAAAAAGVAAKLIPRVNREAADQTRVRA